MSSIKEALQNSTLSKKSKERAKDIKLNLNINIPDNSEQLNEINSSLENIKTQIKIHKENKSLPNNSFDTLYESIAKNLILVAELSRPLFNLQNHIENFYFNEFKKSPALAKELYLNHYADIHYKYNMIKNKCFKLFDDLDELYFKIHNSKPYK